MKHKILYVFVMCLMLFSSCMKHDFEELTELTEQEQIRQNVENIFGTTFDPTHDWTSTMNGSIKIYVNSSEDNIVKAQVLVSCFEEADSSYALRILNEGKISNSENITLVYDTPMNYDNLFVGFINDKGHYFYKLFTINDKEVYYEDVAKTRGEIIGWKPSYPIPSVTPKINGTVVTWANKRGWLPGEVFYTYDTSTTSNSGYDAAFIATFRTVIFNYFPNGRAYNNLPKVKKSGYYNEKVYPITTGDEPIVISPVYKNDGGYKEISQAELYYYYFKGDLTASQIEALPKYRAIDLSTVYSNSDNDNIVKKPSYVLAFFGDGTPTVGQIGSYKFDKGYKIGFCYKSNTTYEAPKKQGEVYGDGRLNYNINNWGNFASSGLGNTDPRMAWMTVNKKMFLCVESGTDKDFNDLILEVEGGIEPIYIDPDEPEYNFYTFLYEDHNLGDYDMNDVVLKGQRIDETTVKWTLMATGAYDDLYIYNVEGPQINKNNEVHDILGGERVTYINTEGSITTPFVINTVTVPKTYSFLDATTQPYIYDATINNTVKIATYGQDPHAIMIPYDFKWPIEKICIKDAYNIIGHEFNSWGSSKIDATDWYKYPNLINVVK